MKNISYADSPYVHAGQISVVGLFQELVPDRYFLRKDGLRWFLSVALPAEECRYKFVLDRYLRLNDPEADAYVQDNKGEVWSVKAADQAELPEKGTLPFLGTMVSSHLIRNPKDTLPRRKLDTRFDQKAVFAAAFGAVRGLHAVTTAWYNPDHHLYHVSEQAVKEAAVPRENTLVQFWIDLQEEGRIRPEGIWTVKLFLDGAYEKEEHFYLGSGQEEGSVYL